MNSATLLLRRALRTNQADQVEGERETGEEAEEDGSAPGAIQALPSWGGQVKKGKRGKDKNKLGAVRQAASLLGAWQEAPLCKPSPWSGPSISLRPSPASKLGRGRRKEGWLRSLHSGLFTNRTVLLGHDTASSF